MDILVAEDDRDAADLYKATLEADGHKVHTTFDGRECIERYKDALHRLAAAGKKPSDHQPYDAVIIDYKLPNVDGLQVVKEMLRLNPHQRVIFASAYARDTLADAVKELSQVELIQKPFEPEVLVDVINDKSVTKKVHELTAVARRMSTIDEKTAENEINVLLERLKQIQKEGTLA